MTAEPLQRGGPPPLKILLADDEEAVRYALSRALRRRGHDVYVAPDAYEARRLAESTAFDVALVDARMPGNGIALIAALAELDAPGNRVVLMSGDLDPAELSTVTPAAILRKPFDIDEMIRLLERIAAGGSTAIAERSRGPVTARPRGGVSSTAAWRIVSERTLVGFCHDLNGRLSALIGLVDLLGPRDEADADAMVMLRSELERLAEAVQQIRTLPGNPGERAEPLHLPALLASVLPLLKRYRGMEEIGVECEPGAESPPVEAPPGELSRVLLVLLAIAGYESLTAGYARVHVGYGSEDGLASVSIEARAVGDAPAVDNAVPMPSDQKEAIAGIRATLHPFGGELRVGPPDLSAGVLARFEVRLPALVG